MPAVVVSGQVLDARGKPLAGARIGWAAGPVALPDVMTVSDRAGRFALSAPVSGDYTLACHTDAGSTTLAVPVGAHAVALTVRMK